jgi:hypothetical protein
MWGVLWRTVFADLSRISCKRRWNVMRGVERVDRPPADAPDELRIERLRRAVASFDRWGGFLKSLYLLSALVFLVTFILTLMFLADLGRFFGKIGAGIAPGFLLGMTIGSWFGFMVINLLHGLLEVFSGLRNERLLIRYYDAYRELGEQLAQDFSEDEGHIGFGDE